MDGFAASEKIKIKKELFTQKLLFRSSIGIIY